MTQEPINSRRESGTAEDLIEEGTAKSGRGSLIKEREDRAREAVPLIAGCREPGECGNHYLNHLIPCSKGC